MLTITITDIYDNTEMITGFKLLKRFRSVSGEKTLAFLILPTEQNAHSYPMVQEESIVEFDGDTYRIKQMSEKPKGQNYQKEGVALHTFFDLIDEHVYEIFTGSMTFQSALQFVLGSYGYTWDIIDTFYAQDFEDFGDSNPIDLFNELRKRYGAEFTINGTHLTFKQKIGDSTDFQLRDGYNIKSIERQVNTNDFSTYIKGFGKKNEDGSYVVQSEYISPLDEANGGPFKRKHAKPVRDERYTTLEGLDERLRAEIKEVPDVSIPIDFVDLRRAGFPYDVPSEGDDMFLIVERMGLDLETRIMDITEEFTEFSDIPIKTDVTLANFRNSMADQFVEFSRTQKTVEGVMNGSKTIPYNALDDAVKRATAALQSAQTELEFENGIIARDKNNPNFLVLLNSNGIGISRDGGTTFKEAITSEGFVLSAGAIGQLSANNIQIGAETFFEDGYDPSKINSDTNSLIDGLQTQIDGKVETFFYVGIPSLTNIPASGWADTATKDIHIGDLYYDTATGKAYRFKVVSGTYSWENVQDKDIVTALTNASKAQDTADGKRRVFTAQPVPPYDVGDLWSQGPTGDLMRCKVAKATGTYAATDWEKAVKYTDDGALANYVLTSTYTGDKSALQMQIDGKTETWFYAGIPSLTNVPASGWADNTTKDIHTGDLYFDTATKKVYRFKVVSGTYSWELLQDADIQTALSNASTAQSTADSKMQVFTSQPVPPYDIGDLWAAGSSTDLMKCKVARLTGSYVSSDWEKAVKYTDDSALANYVTSSDYSTGISGLQTQIDGKVETWFYSGVPTLANVPASTWTDTTTKNNHVNDLYFDMATKKVYRFKVVSTTYSWELLQDSDIQTALANASTAQSTADKKMVVFTTQPVPPYDIGDLWVQGTAGDIMHCIVARSTGSYTASDWSKSAKYTDDTATNNLKDDLRMTAPLPTSLTLNQDGITASTGTTDKYARMDYRGFYAKKGAFAVEREDGFLSVNNGILQNDFTIVGADPPFRANEVTINEFWWKTFDSTPRSCNYYTFMHNSRYLKILAALFSGGSGSKISIYDKDGVTVLATLVTNDTSQTSSLALNGDIITIDLGVPTGVQKSIYVRLNSGSVTGENAGYGRVLKMWKEG